MEINYLAILVCAALSTAVSALWFGPFFGKRWDEITKNDTARFGGWVKIPLVGPIRHLIYFILFLLLAIRVEMHSGFSRLSEKQLWIVGIFILLYTIGVSIWSKASTKISISKFGIIFSYLIIILLIFGFTLVLL